MALHNENIRRCLRNLSLRCLKTLPHPNLSQRENTVDNTPLKLPIQSQDIKRPRSMHATVSIPSLAKIPISHLNNCNYSKQRKVKSIGPIDSPTRKFRCRFLMLSLALQGFVSRISSWGFVGGFVWGFLVGGDLVEMFDCRF